MKLKVRILGVAIGGALVTLAAQAQDNMVKLGISRYTTHESSSGLSATPPVLPPGSGVDVGDATTAVVMYERILTPNVTVELVLGWPPKIDAKGTGPAAALGDPLLSVRHVGPVLLANYYFGDAANRWRPYVGAGVNYTHFTDIHSSLPTSKLSLSDSFGWAATAGLSFAADRNWGLFASVTRLDVKTDVDAIATIPGVPVPVQVKSTLNLKPVTYQTGFWYRF